MPLPPSASLAAPPEYAFTGKVVQRNAATIPGVPLAPTVAVVALIVVFRTPTIVRLHAGAQITVVTKSASDPPIDEGVLWEADGWLYGRSIAVVERSHRLISVAPGQLVEQLVNEHEVAAREALRERVRLADVVVSGKVVATRELPVHKGSLSEHSPLWAEATLEPVVEKGQVPEGPLHVYYAASQDIRWVRSPKPAVGEQGVWFLHRQYVDALKGEALTLLDARDAHPIAALARVRALVREPSGPR